MQGQGLWHSAASFGSGVEFESSIPTIGVQLTTILARTAIVGYYPDCLSERFDRPPAWPKFQPLDILVFPFIEQRNEPLWISSNQVCNPLDFILQRSVELLPRLPKHRPKYRFNLNTQTFKKLLAFVH